MLFLRKPPNISLYSFSILHRFTTLTAKPNPNNRTSAYYDNLAAESFISGNLNSLRDILNNRAKDHCFNTNRTFNFITNTNFTPSLLNDVVKTLSTLNPGITRKNAFDSLLSRLCKLHRVDDALRVVESMSSVSNCNLNTHTFHPILNFLTSKHSLDLDHARRVVEVMARLGIRLDLTAHCMFLAAHCFSGDVDAAVEVLKTMEEEGLGVDAHTYDALVMGACKVGNVDGAMVLVKRMVDDGVPMLYSTHLYVIDELLKMECYELVVKYVRCISKKYKVLENELFGCLSRKLVGLKKVKEAVLVLGEMEERGLTMSSKLRDFYEMNVGVGSDDTY